jgi:hypothetical protein
MARGSRASKGRGPTRRERREAAARAKREGRNQETEESPKKLTTRRERAAARVRRDGRADRQQRTRSRAWRTLLGRESRSRLVYSGVVVLAAVLTLAIGVGWWLAARPPGWWAEVDTASPGVVSTSRAVENWAVSTMTRQHPHEERWAVTITEEDANAWLAVRLPLWVESEYGEWPEGIRSVRVRFHDGRVIVGADIREPGAKEARVVAAALEVEIDEDGSAQAGIGWTQINRLKLPGAIGLNRLSEWIDSAGEGEIADRLGELVRGELNAEALDWRLEDGRRVTVHDIRIEGGELSLTCSTSAAPVRTQR